MNFKLHNMLNSVDMYHANTDIQNKKWVRFADHSSVSFCDYRVEPLGKLTIEKSWWYIFSEK